MNVFYHPEEQEFRPRQSLFNGKTTPYPDVPERTGSILRALETELEIVAGFAPDSVVVSLGFDTVAGDPMGSFRLRVEECEEMGRPVAELGMPLLVVQEGGYVVSALGQYALKFFAGLGAPGGKPCP